MAKTEYQRKDVRREFIRSDRSMTLCNEQVRPCPKEYDLLTVLARSEFSSAARSEEHTSELQSLMRISYAVFCLTTKNNTIHYAQPQHILRSAIQNRNTS